jgi:hypothetical protein
VFPRTKYYEEIRWKYFRYMDLILIEDLPNNEISILNRDSFCKKITNEKNSYFCPHYILGQHLLNGKIPVDLLDIAVRVHQD